MKISDHLGTGSHKTGLNRRELMRATALGSVALGLVALPTAAPAQDKGTIGISMPTKSVARWIADGDNMVKLLAAAGYKADLQFAENDIPGQLAQIENMITKKVKVLVIAPIDGTTLSEVLQRAADAGIKVIAYDRLIVGSPNVDYYATFDNYKIGELLSHSLIKGLGLEQGRGPFNIEYFAGSADDNNTYLYYNGSMAVLKPYIDSGKLIVPSGQLALDKVATPNWDAKQAQDRMDNLLSAYYTKKHLDAVLSPYDGLSIGIISALKSIGYGTKDMPMPIITGQNAEVPAVKAIINHEQYSTTFKDTRLLAKVAADMVDALLSGRKPEVNDTTTYNNKIKVVPSYLVQATIVDATNWKKILIDDSHYYTADQFQ